MTSKFKNLFNLISHKFTRSKNQFLRFYRRKLYEFANLKNRFFFLYRRVYRDKIDEYASLLVVLAGLFLIVKLYYSLFGFFKWHAPYDITINKRRHAVYKVWHEFLIKYDLKYSRIKERLGKYEFLKNSLPKRSYWEQIRTLCKFAKISYYEKPRKKMSDLRAAYIQKSRSLYRKYKVYSKWYPRFLYYKLFPEKYLELKRKILAVRKRKREIEQENRKLAEIKAEERQKKFSSLKTSRQRTIFLVEEAFIPVYEKWISDLAHRRNERLAKSKTRSRLEVRKARLENEKLKGNREKIIKQDRENLLKRWVGENERAYVEEKSDGKNNSDQSF